MSRLLLNLRHVPDDEAEEVRALLNEHGISFYETQAGRWRISLAGIWVEDADYPQAQAHFSAYQEQRAQRIRQEHAEAHARGEFPSFIEHLRHNRSAVAVSVIAILIVLGLTLWPWWKW